MSATRIIAQSVPMTAVAFPGWKFPVLVRLVATGAGASVPLVVAADTSPAILIARTGVGQLQITFPAARRLGNINPQVWGLSPETAATRKTAKVDGRVANTFASVQGSSLGQIQLFVSEDVNAANADLVAVDILDVSFWLDLG